MKNLALVVSAISALTLTSCFENLNIPGSNDTQTSTAVETPTNTQTDCSIIDSHIDFTFNVNEATNIVEFDASPSNYSECLNDKTFDSYSWDFGDETVIETNSDLSFHHYPNNGLYSVTLTAIYEGSTISTTREVAVNDTQVCDAIISSAHFTADYDSSGLVTFDASSSYLFEDCQYHEITEYNWDFGNGETVISQGNMFTYELEPGGIYPVTLSIYYNGKEYTYSEVIDFGVSCTQPYLENPSTFNYYISDSNTINVDASQILINNCEDATILEYVWQMGDGTVYENAESMLSHTYSSNGLYQVSLSVITTTRVYNFSESVQLFNFCNATPISVFESIVDGKNVLFDASGSDAGPVCEIMGSEKLIYLWDFGEGNSTTTDSPFISHQYKYDDTYVVTLTVINSEGKSSPHTDIIVIESIISACDFDASEHNFKSYVHEYTATFDASNVFGYGCEGRYLTGEYVWDFGDGNTLTTDVPFVSHTYSNNNEYVVSVRNADNFVALNIVNIEYHMVCTDDIPTSYCSSPSPVLTIQATPSDEYSSSVMFSLTDTTYNSEENTYSWISSEGHAGTGSTFTTNFYRVGVFDVMLKAERKNGEVYATVIQFEKASQSCDVFDVPAPIEIETGTDVIIDYPEIALYPVEDPMLLIPLPVNNIEVVKSAVSGKQISFEMLWGVEPICKTFIWDFGDGHLLETNRFDVTHEYALSGNYLVKVGDGFNNGSINVSVEGSSICDVPPLASFTSYSNSLTTHFDATGSMNCSDDTIYEWTFAYGEIIETNSPYISHTFDHSQTYEVTLSIQETNAFQTQSIVVEQVLIDLSYDYTSIELAFEFTAQASTLYPSSVAAEPSPVHDVIIGEGAEGDIVYDPIQPVPYLEEYSYEWNFGDGNYATGQWAYHNYQTPGYYDVSVTAFNNFTYESEVKQFRVSAQYEPEPEVLTVAIEAIILGSQVEFSSLVDTNYERPYLDLLYIWDFGDGAQASLNNIPSEYHYYEQPGTYEVTLEVREYNSYNVATATISIVIP